MKEIFANVVYELRTSDPDSIRNNARLFEVAAAMVEHLLTTDSGVSTPLEGKMVAGHMKSIFERIDFRSFTPNGEQVLR